MASDNLISNPSAETGDLSGWTATDVAVVDGGTDGSKCFQFGANSSIYQDLGPQNPLAVYEVRADFAPAIPWGINPQVGAYVYFELSYEDGTKDIYMFPMRTEVMIGNFHRMKAFIPTRENSSPIQVRLTAVTRGLAGGGQFDNISVILAGEGNALQEGVPYYGVTIGRANGLKIERSDGASRVIMNSDYLAMEVEGVPKIYFDPVDGNYIFDGKLSAGVIQAVEAEIDIAVSNTVIVNNLYAEKGNISELTVDQLDTSTKVQKRLNNDISPVYYIKAQGQRIQLIEANTTGDQSAQLLNRYGQPLFWVDEQRRGSTTNETDWPIMIYVYDESIKMEILFELDSVTGLQVPRMIWGAGVGHPGDPDRGKGFIFKDDLGLVLQYKKATGQVVQFRLSENGAQVTSSLSTSKAVRNIYISSNNPDANLMEEGDIWLKY